MRSGEATAFSFHPRVELLLDAKTSGKYIAQLCAIYFLEDFEDNGGEYDDHCGIGGENWLQIVTRGTLKYCDLWNIDDGTEA